MPVPAGVDPVDSYLSSLDPKSLYDRYVYLANNPPGAVVGGYSAGVSPLDETNLFAFKSAKHILGRDPTLDEVVSGKGTLLYDSSKLKDTYAIEHPVKIPSDNSQMSPLATVVPAPVGNLNNRLSSAYYLAIGAALLFMVFVWKKS